MSKVEVYGKKNPAVPFHPAVRAGDFVFVSGLVARNEKGILVSGSIEEESRVALDQMKRILAAAGCELGDIVSANVYLDDARDIGRMNEVFKEYFPEGRMARTTVEARAVIDCKIEIDCIAYKPLAK
jgi:2-iminobutanoate/2-iminopropanoate deaminase